MAVPSDEASLRQSMDERAERLKPPPVGDWGSLIVAKENCTTFLKEIDDKLGMGKSQELLERIANSGADTAWQARWAVTARKLLGQWVG